MAGGYSALASVYDRLNKGFDYDALTDYIEKCFNKYLKEKPGLVLDLGCGTGAVTIRLSDRGYDMTGIDYSPEMLDIARDAAERVSGVISTHIIPNTESETEPLLKLNAFDKK